MILSFLYQRYRKNKLLFNFKHLILARSFLIYIYNLLIHVRSSLKLNKIS